MGFITAKLESDSNSHAHFSTIWFIEFELREFIFPPLIWINIVRMSNCLWIFLYPNIYGVKSLSH